MNKWEADLVSADLLDQIDHLSYSRSFRSFQSKSQLFPPCFSLDTHDPSHTFCSCDELGPNRTTASQHISSFINCETFTFITTIIIYTNAHQHTTTAVLGVFHLSISDNTPEWEWRLHCEKRSIFRNGIWVLENATPQERVQRFLTARKSFLISSSPMPFSVKNPSFKVFRDSFQRTVSCRILSSNRCVRTIRTFPKLSNNSIHTYTRLASRSTTARFSPR